MGATSERFLHQAGVELQPSIPTSTAAAGFNTFNTTAAASAAMRPVATLGLEAQHHAVTSAALAIFNNLCGAAQSIAPLVHAVGGAAACGTVLAFAATLGSLGRGDPVPASATVLRASLSAPTGSERLCPTCRGPVRPL